MQAKVNLLCRDSILTAAQVLDLALFLDLFQRAGLGGIQEWLTYYLEDPPRVPAHPYPKHHIFIQLTKLKNTLRSMAEEHVITRPGPECYE